MILTRGKEHGFHFCDLSSSIIPAFLRCDNYSLFHNNFAIFTFSLNSTLKYNGVIYTLISIIFFFQLKLQQPQLRQLQLVCDAFVLN